MKARKSVVRVLFESGINLTYYNDLFDLHQGDTVYVEVKLEGKRARVNDVNYNFKVKVSDYKKVIALVDTDIKGKLFSAGSHFITFDRKALPKEKIKLWFIPPETGNGETVTGRDNSCFDLGNLKSMKVSAETAERGYNYYAENEVVYLSLEGDKGYAIIEGTKPYEVEFKYRNGKISVLTCS